MTNGDARNEDQWSRPPDHPANVDQPTAVKLRRLVDLEHKRRGDAYPFDQPKRTPDVTGTNLGSWDETVVDGIVLRWGKLVATTSVPADEDDSGSVVVRSGDIPPVDAKQPATIDWLAESRDNDD